MKDPCHIQGDIPVAFIVTKDGTSNNMIHEKIQTFCNRNIIDYAVPEKYYFINELPLTPNGKVDYRALEKEAEKEG